jgi:hypothetical protein
MRKQQREPGMELVPLEYVMVTMEQTERELREGAHLAATMEAASSRETEL